MVNDVQYHFRLSIIFFYFLRMTFYSTLFNKQVNLKLVIKSLIAIKVINCFFEQQEDLNSLYNALLLQKHDQCSL